VYASGNGFEEWIGVNHQDYGHGIYWCHLTANEIWVYGYTPQAADVRVRIWKIAQP